MQGPRCQSTLKIGERSGVEIDYCESCRGIWLDSGEIDKIIERNARYHGGSQQGQSRRDDNDQGRRESWWENILDIFD